MSFRLEQFIKFTTSSLGLERAFRFIQSVVQILTFFPLPFGLLLQAAALASGSSSPTAAATARAVLVGLNQRLNATRRYFRLGWSVEFFYGAYKMYSQLTSSTSPSSSSKKSAPPAWVRLEPWLAMSARTFNGLFFLLDGGLAVDSLGVPGLRVWTVDQERRIGVEALRFWFLGLVCGLLFNLLEILNVLAYTPVPATGSGFGGDVGAEGEKKTEKKSEDSSLNEKDDDLKKEQERLRSLVKDRKQQRILWRREIRGKITKLGRGAAASALDILLPGSALGWIKVEPGTVAMAMLATTVLTSIDVWDKCGQDVKAGK
ncbi:peroxisomal biogenesis factor 11 [Hypoxylon sp. FL1284]|nr:peroxisomal biogenesis factor 11 [Hypoxylon sp. FL1284]